MRGNDQHVDHGESGADQRCNVAYTSPPFISIPQHAGMPVLIFGMGIAEPSAACGAVHSGWKIAWLAVRRDTLTQAFYIAWRSFFHGAPRLLQLHILRLGLLQDGDVRVGMFEMKCLWPLYVKSIDFVRADVPYKQWGTIRGNPVPFCPGTEETMNALQVDQCFKLVLPELDATEKRLAG
jgi:hypothetical protein